MKTAIRNVEKVELSGGDTKLPIIGMDVTYSINNPPTAVIQPGEGLGFDGDVYQFGDTSDKETEWSVDMSVLGNVFKGTLSSFGASIENTPIYSTRRKSLVFEGMGGDLKNIPGSGFVYWSGGQDISADYTAQEVKDSVPMRLLQVSMKSLLSKDVREGEDVGGFIIEYMNNALNSTGAGEAVKGSNFDLDNYFSRKVKVGFQSNLKGDLLPLWYTLASKINSTWMGSDVWTTMMSLCDIMFLQTVFMEDKYKIEPKNPWYAGYRLTLNPNHILNVSPKIRINRIQENADAVFSLYQPGEEVPKNADGTTNPKNLYISYPNGKRWATPGYAIQVDIPDWLKYVEVYKTFLKKEDTRTKTENDVKGYTKSLAEAIVKLYYSIFKNNKVSLTLSVNWFLFSQLRYAVGQVIRIIFPEAYLGEETVYYGYINSVTLAYKSIDKGSELKCLVNITHVRGQQDNEEYGLEGHPIYEVTGLSSAGSSALAERPKVLRATLL